MPQPRALVAPAALQPARYGLESVLVPRTDGRWELGGVESYSDACATAHIWPDPCGETPPSTERTVTVTVTGVGATTPYVVTITLAASGDATDSTVTAAATVDDGPERTISITVGAEDPVVITTGAPAAVVAEVASDDTYEVAFSDVATGDTGVPEDLVIDAAGDAGLVLTPLDVDELSSALTAVATVDTGPVRTVLLTVAGETPVVLTTGAAPASVGDVPRSATYEVTATDLTNGTSEAGSLVIDVAGDGTEEVEVAVTDYTAKTVESGRATAGGDPFTLYATASCKLIDPDEAASIALTRLTLGEPRALEEAFWLGEMGNTPALVTGDVTVLPAAASLVAGVAALEHALGVAYAGIGVIHADRRVIPYAARDGLLVRDRTILRTPAETMWAFGAGYDGVTGPTGETDAAATATWLFATGAVSRWRGEVFTNPTGPAALDRTTNEVTVIAERTYVLTRDCDIAFAIKVTL